MDTLRKRMRREEGFSLIELVIALVIIGVIMAIAIPVFLGVKDRAHRSTAQANVRSAVPAIEIYALDQNGSYVGMTQMTLRLIDAGVAVSVPTATATSYCAQAASGGFTFSKNGPAAPIVRSACPTP